MQKDQAFVELIVKEIVDNPDKVTTERTVDERGVLITLTVSAEDMGKLIGKEGRTAKAIRTLLRVLGAKNDARVNLKIAEPEGGTGGRPREVLLDDSANVSSEQPAANEQPAVVDETPTESDSTPTAIPIEPTPATDEEGQATELI